MIRVNLLPEAQKTRAAKPSQRVKRDIPYTWIAIGLVVFLITCAGLGILHLSIQKKAKAVTDEIDMYRAQINKLKIDVSKVEKVKVQRNELNNKLAIIDKLKSAQKGPVHLLDQLASCIPSRVWLTSMSENGEAMILDGKALEHAGISKFMQNLEKSPFFSNVELSSAVTEQMHGKNRNVGENVKSFHLTCNIQIPQDLL